MQAVVIDAPGGPEVLQIRRVPIPAPKAGQILIRVEAFGLNRSELHFRTGVASTGTFPRIPGIEAVGTVEAAPGGEFAPDTQVAAMMGGVRPYPFERMLRGARLVRRTVTPPGIGFGV